MTSLHERMMQSHGGDAKGDHKGMPKGVTSYDITLKSKRQIAEDTYEFTFAKPGGIEYKAGQHGRMTLINPAETDDEGNVRFLSFASTPDEPDLTFAMRMRDTAFKRVLSQLQPGAKVLWQMRKNTPHGSFALQDAADVEKPVVFLVGGIGVVPVYSMIRDALQHGARHKITLIYSNRRSGDAAYLRDFRQLSKQYSNVFQFVPTMTEPEKSAQVWPGEIGYITSEMVQKYVSDLQDPIYYIAGLTEMVTAMQKLLADVGVSKDNIRAEEFGAFATAHGNGHSADKSKRVVALIAALVVIMVIAHIVGVSSIVKAGYDRKYIELQAMTVLVIAMLMVVYLKIKLVRKHLGKGGR